jgi:hypothetical protein
MTIRVLRTREVGNQQESSQHFSQMQRLSQMRRDELLDDWCGDRLEVLVRRDMPRIRNACDCSKIQIGPKSAVKQRQNRLPNRAARADEGEMKGTRGKRVFSSVYQPPPQE